MSLFSNLKEKLTAKIDEFKTATAPGDPLERQANELVDKACSETLIAPEWSANLACVDFINADVRLNSGRALRAMKRNMSKPNGKVQLLLLTLLETCVKNCAAEFHVHLAASELWQELLKVASGAAVPPADPEVRDQALALVEDFARALAPPQFQAAYEMLLDQGITFLARSVDDSAPYLTPPAAVGGAAATAAAPAPGAVDHAAAAAAAEDPLAGVDEQDRAAIQAALAELEQEAQAAQEAERVAAEADAEERRQLAAAQDAQRQQEQQQAEAAAAAGLIFAAESATAAAAAAAQHGEHAPAGGAHGAEGRGAAPVAGQQQQQQDEEAAAAAAVAAAEEEAARETPAERATKLMEMCSNSCLLLSEMLAGIPDDAPLGVREPYVVELADGCVRLRSRLERVVSGGGGEELDEALLASALSQHEELSRVLGRYEELIAAAESISPSPQPQPRQQRPPRQAVPPPLPHEALPPHAHQFRGGSGPVPVASAEPDALDVASQKVAAAAAVIKEKVTATFDKLAASWATYRAGAAGAGGAASGASSVPLLGAAYEPAAAAAGVGPGSGGASATAYGHGAVSGGGGGLLRDGGASGGHFTLADDEEGEEGGALVAKRTGGPVAAPPPPSQAQAQALQPVSSVPGPDLINFDDEPAPAPAAGTNAAIADLLAPAAAAAAAAAPPAAGAVGGGGVSRAVSNNDQLVEALDRLVSAESSTPLAGAGGSGVVGGAAAAAAGHSGLAEVPEAAVAAEAAAETEGAKPAH